MIRNRNFTIIILVNVVVFFLISLIYKEDATRASYIIFGVEKTAVLEYNQIYRLLTYSFVHADIMHLVLNMLALNSLADIVIRFTSEKFSIALYFIAAIVSGIGIVLFTNQITIGASGAVYGLFGILIYFSIKQYRMGNSEMFRSILPIILINLFISLAPGISLVGHLGGLIVGLIGSFIYDKKIRKTYW